MTAGAPPPAPIIEAVEKMNFNTTHVYGMAIHTLSRNIYRTIIGSDDILFEVESLTHPFLFHIPSLQD